MTILAELQDKARNMLAESRASADPTLLHLIEELCRVGERIKEESQKERLDLLLQVSGGGDFQRHVLEIRNFFM